MEKFRNLKAEEIEVRVQQVGEGWVQVLLYKNARVDMAILDETVGPMNWSRKHYECKGNLFCEVSIFEPCYKQWISKSDCGTESNTEKEKGEASDSFKRACTNWGIGRELYTSPAIFINTETTDWNGKKQIKNKKERYKVSDIETIDGKIVFLEIQDQTNKVRFTYGKKSK